MATRGRCHLGDKSSLEREGRCQPYRRAIATCSQCFQDAVAQHYPEAYQEAVARCSPPFPSSSPLNAEPRSIFLAICQASAHP